jgi:hypothetical protein
VLCPREFEILGIEEANHRAYLFPRKHGNKGVREDDVGFLGSKEVTTESKTQFRTFFTVPKGPSEALFHVPRVIRTLYFSHILYTIKY